MLRSKFTKCGIPVEEASFSSEKILLALCDMCGKELEITASNYHWSQKKKNNSGETLCRSCSCKKNGIERRGKYSSPMKGIFIKPEDRKRNDWLSTDGYNMIYDADAYREDDKKNKAYKGYRKEHVLVMEKHIKRKIKPGEEVHHVDGNRINNKLSNLLLLTSQEHKNLHSQLRKLSNELIQKGIIIFDRKNCCYKLKE